MAAALLSQLACRSKRIHGLFVDSAGTSANDGAEANRDAIETMKIREIDLSVHRSKSLSRSLVEGADLILTMTRGHKEGIFERFPESQSKVWTLGSYAATGGEIDDPLGRGVQAYEKCASQLETLLSRVADRLSGGEA